MASGQCKAWTELEDQAPPLTLQAFPDRLSLGADSLTRLSTRVHNQVAIHEPSASSQRA